MFEKDANYVTSSSPQVVIDQPPNAMIVANLVKELGVEGLTPEERQMWEQMMPQKPEFVDHHYANLAEITNENVLSRIATDIIRYVLFDEQSREEWQIKESRGMRLLGVSTKTENAAPFKGSSKAVHPLLMEAVNQFHARCIVEMWPADGPVKTEVLGDPTPELEDQAERVADYLNWMYTVRMPGAFEEEDQMLFRLPVSGSCFKDIYFDPLHDTLVSKFIEPSDFIVPFTATSLSSATRYTYRQRISQHEMKGYQEVGFFRDTPMSLPSNETYDYPWVKTEIDFTEGKQNNLVIEDMRHTLYRTNMWLDLEGFEHRDGNQNFTGKALPYIVWVDRDNQRVMRIQRNWIQGDALYRRDVTTTHYKFTPGYGFYGYGLLHLIGGLSSSSTGALRALLDSAQFSNMQGGFRTKDAKIPGGAGPIAPGEWREVQCSIEDLQKGFFRIPYHEPSPTLFKLLEYLDGRAQRFVGTTENMVGEGNANAAVGTTLALIEQGSKQFSAIHMRLHLAHQHEFRVMKRMAREYMPQGGIRFARGQRTGFVTWDDLHDSIDIIPVSDPHIISSTQRIAQAQAILTLSQQFPNRIDQDEAIRRMLIAMRVQKIDALLKPQQPDPMMVKRAELELQKLVAEIGKIVADTENAGANATASNIKALYEALQAAQGVVMNPGIVPIADSISKSAGFIDKDGGSLAGDAQGQQAGGMALIPPNPQTDPNTPASPSMPVPQPGGFGAMPQLSSPAQGAAEGIEQPGNQIQ